ncbi:MAG: hypothetical protein J5963_06715 [Schwartzia sp.]|nr:hypothetical protein [Schwartzia sp. (in: firmicutes)]
MGNTDGSRSAESGRKPLFVGLLSLLVLGGIVLGWLFVHPGDKVSPPATDPSAQSAEESGVVRLGEVVRKHPEYGTLLRLRGEHAQLSDALARGERQLLKMTAPDAIKKPFDDAVDQKKKQVLIKEYGEFMEKLAEAEKAKREETRALYDAARGEINAAYFNEIFNTQLKIDNADVMRLSEETVADLKRHLENLQRERGRHLYDLHLKYEAEIRAFKEALAAEHGVSLAALEQETDERLRAEEMRKRSEAQARNLEALQKNMLDSVELRMRLTEIRTALRAKEQEITALEDGLTLELAGKAAKLAVLHHLSIVYASPVTAGLPIAGVGTDPAAGLRVVGVTAVDLTEELIKEIEKGNKKE